MYINISIYDIGVYNPPLFLSVCILYKGTLTVVFSVCFGPVRFGL